jgi:hypothetical protein
VLRVIAAKQGMFAFVDDALTVAHRPREIEQSTTNTTKNTNYEQLKNITKPTNNRIFKTNSA